MPNLREPESGNASDTSQQTMAGVKARFPIDGVIDFSGLQALSSVLNFIDMDSNIVRTTPISRVVIGDDLNLYMAFQWQDDTHNNVFDDAGPVNFDGIKLMFDIDGNGRYDEGEDARTVIAARSGSQYIDQHKDSGDETDAVANGRGKLRYDAENEIYSAEFLIPLNDDQSGHDGIVSSKTVFNFQLYDNVRIGPLVSGYRATYSDSEDTSQWIAIELSEDMEYSHPSLPDHLNGLIVFISTQEVDSGEIYSLYPASGVVEKITDLPDLFKDNVSLSHDRTRVAFHGSGDKNDYSAYEIYTINIDGSNLRQLTDNETLDGHPAWSPGDRSLAYTSFRGPGGQENIILMDDNGAEFADLTPDGVNDNDADFLPSGEIVFKTDRFSENPQFRIALMFADGSNLRQLTDFDNSSDHDAVGTDTTVIFERFNKSTDYSSDPDALFIPWDIIEVNLETMEERIIVADAWLNWLPVYDPSGQYILHLKSMGYTGMFLINRDGEELGQLATDFTRITYLDWK